MASGPSETLPAARGEMRTERHETTLVAANFERPSFGPVWQTEDETWKAVSTGLPGWQSNGGSTRGHPAKSLPFALRISVPDHGGQLIRIHVIGVFALFADRESEAPGTLGATLQIRLSDQGVAARFDLINGRHYLASTRFDVGSRVIGDGSSVESLGECVIEGEPQRVDILSLDVPIGTRPRFLHFQDLGSPASFILFDVVFEFEEVERRYKHRSHGALHLPDLSLSIRVGDRLKLVRSLERMDSVIDEAEDLDEARSIALLVLAVAAAAVIEAGTRMPPAFLLDAARELESLQSRSQIKTVTRNRMGAIAMGLLAPSETPSDRLVDRALAIVERHFAKDLTDAMVAAQLGLSTSHFRFLFKQATGHPFHKYLVALRLERARQMLIEQEVPISQVATAVGFTGLSHFSRAFTQRFSASPSHIRRMAG